MRTLLPTFLLIILVTFCPATDALSPPEDLEASGDDLEMEGSGSGSGGGSDEVIPDEKSTSLGSSKDGTDSFNTHKFIKNVLQEPEVEPWEREATIIQESRSIMKSKEVLAGVIAGGVTGLVLAVLLGGILIYKWQKKDTDGYTLGHTSKQYHRDMSQAHHGEDTVLV